MPQVQFVDQPNWGSALGQFGSGVLGEYTAGQERRQEEDALQSMLAEAKRVRDAGGSEEDVISSMIGFPGLGLEKKKNVMDIYKDVGKRRSDIASKSRQEEREERKLQIQEERLKNEVQKLDKKDRQSYFTEVGKYEVGENTLNEMDKLVDKNNLGMLARFDPTDKARSDIAEWELLSKSLISYVMSGVSIRNKHEFLSAAERLTDPYTRDATKRGIINGLRKRIEEEKRTVQNKYGIEDGSERGQQESGPTLDEIRAAIKRKRGG